MGDMGVAGCIPRRFPAAQASQHLAMVLLAPSEYLASHFDGEEAAGVWSKGLGPRGHSGWGFTHDIACLQPRRHPLTSLRAVACRAGGGCQVVCSVHWLGSGSGWFSWWRGLLLQLLLLWWLLLLWLLLLVVAVVVAVVAVLLPSLTGGCCGCW
jgi:hypothetical protein